jgi:hypothetical protein
MWATPVARCVLAEFRGLLVSRTCTIAYVLFSRLADSLILGSDKWLRGFPLQRSRQWSQQWSRSGGHVCGPNCFYRILSLQMGNWLQLRSVNWTPKFIDLSSHTLLRLCLFEVYLIPSCSGADYTPLWVTRTYIESRVDQVALSMCDDHTRQFQSKTKSALGCFKSAHHLSIQPPLSGNRSPYSTGPLQHVRQPLNRESSPKLRRAGNMHDLLHRTHKVSAIDRRRTSKKYRHRCSPDRT